ncbi:hypothetical protein ACWCOV_37020 [Kribbella sp. NPDC002412]
MDIVTWDMRGGPNVPGLSTYHDGSGYTLYMVNACARAKIDSHFADGVVPPRGARC